MSTELIIDGLCLLAAVAALAFTLLPFLRPRAAGAGVDLEAEDLFLAKEYVYANIKDLDFDHQVGKIEDEDYQRMRSSLKREASEILDRIERLRGPARREALEREIARRRGNGAACPACGAAVAADARFCPQCGKPVS
ncbi:MAG: zinc-ribbon domain-containing protein [Nitrospirae bacterium]|nr:MAG: zinc-ribbon domain-containing protein [Nitrospirota bacterium]